MPIHECTLPDGGGKGYKWGGSGKCFKDRADAVKQAEAAYSNGYTGDMSLDEFIEADGKPNVAMDSTARTFDKDGAMHIAQSHIAKVGVNPYYGNEIPGCKELGLDPAKIYQLFRSPEELEKGAASFARKFILSKHVPVTLYETMDEQEKKKLIVGTIGSDIEFTDPFVNADVCIADAAAIAGIETDTVREFSPAYHYKPLMITGKYKGQSYDGIMIDIRANHLCLVEAGRQGPDVLAADSKLREPMKTTKFGKALIAALGTGFPKLALDAAFKPLMAEQTRKSFNKADVRAKLIAMDAETAPEQLDAVMDAMLDDEPEAKEPKEKTAKDAKHGEDCTCEDCKMGKDEDDEEEEKNLTEKKKKAEDKKAKDEKEDEKDEKVKHAMDSLRTEMREAREAALAVRPVVGDVVAMDSASEIYGFALDQMKIDHKGVDGVPALRALFNLANSKKSAAPIVAMDSAAITAKFPGANRFRQA